MGRTMKGLPVKGRALKGLAVKISVMDGPFRSEQS